MSVKFVDNPDLGLKMPNLDTAVHISFKRHNDKYFELMNLQNR